jgi:hypothetical protein
MTFLSKIRSWLFPPKLTRKDCPHWNVEGNGMCNLLPDPWPCVGYSKCKSIKRYQKLVSNSNSDFKPLNKPPIQCINCPYPEMFKNNECDECLQIADAEASLRKKETEQT